MQVAFKVEMVDGGWRGQSGVRNRVNIWSAMYSFICATRVT